MQVAQYVALSAQLALERQMEAVARNVANAGTAGYRAEGVAFEAMLSSVIGGDKVAYASEGRNYVSGKAGPLTRTDHPLDVAVEGDAWLAIQSPAGAVYTRDGRMTMLPTGELVTVNGYPVLDVGGAPILLDPDAGPPQIARDGMITQGGAQLGAIGLFTIDAAARFTRHDNSAVIPDRAAQPVLDFTATGVVQGFVEGSNVDPMLELTRLIMISRSFESAAAAVRGTDESLTEAVRALGQS